MNSARGHPADYIHHMIASPDRYTSMETARRQSQADTTPAPDALTRPLHLQPQDTRRGGRKPRGRCRCSVES